MPAASLPAENRIPVSILTGFLGSGKTTLLNHLLQDPAMAKCLVIINEFGEIGIDHLLVSVPSENMMLLNNGCLCCVLKGDLVETFSAIHAKRSRGEIPWFDRVIVETTGLADPVPVIQTIVTDEDICDDFRLELVATLVDGVHGEAQLGQSAESVKQVVVADTLLISKTDLASAAGLAGLRERLRRVNPGDNILDVHQGQIPLASLLGGEARDAARKVEEIKRWLDAEARTESYRQLPQGHVLHGHPDARADDRHDPHLLTFSLSYEGPIRRSAVALWLNMLANFLGADLLRVKGILNVEGEPVVIHIVQTIVHEPAVLNQWPSDDRQSRIVFITRNIARSQIEKTLEVFAVGESSVPSGPGLAIDPEVYANFAKLAKNFMH